MTDTIEKPVGTEEIPPMMAPTRPNKLGPTAYGNGPVIAAGVLVGGALLLGGWGMSQMVMDHQEKQAAAVVAPADPGLGEARKNADGTVTVRLPDKDGNGVPDVLEGGERKDPEDNGTGSAPGCGGDKTDPPATEKQPPVEQKPKNRVYQIRTGDTLTSISAETGVPVGILVETNHIQDPNLIYAGSALLIPSVG